MTTNNIKQYIFILFCSFPIASYGGEIDVSAIKCKLPGCVVSCLYKENNKLQITNIEEIKVTIYSNAITKFELNKGVIDGIQTLIVGPESYMCDITNQKN